MCVFRSISVFLTFDVYFRSFLHEKTMRKMMHLFTAAPFFLDLPTLTIVWFLQYESYFFGFGLFDVFHSKCLKIQPKTEAQKNEGKTCQRAPKIIPKWIKIPRFCARKRPLAPKKRCFVDLSFLCFFRCHFLTLFGGFWVHFGLPGKNNFNNFWPFS